MSSAANKKLLRGVFEQMACGNTRALADAMAEEVRWTFPGSVVVVGDVGGGMTAAAPTPARGMRRTVLRAQCASSLRALLAQRAALRRVAALGAGDAPPQAVFERVCREAGALLGVEATELVRFQDDGTRTVLARWSLGAVPSDLRGGALAGAREAALRNASRSDRPARVDHRPAGGAIARNLAGAGNGAASAVAVPITLAATRWGAIVASTARPHSLGPGAEHGLADFTQLIGDALSAADAREQLAGVRAELTLAREELALARDELHAPAAASGP